MRPRKAIVRALLLLSAGGLIVGGTTCLSLRHDSRGSRAPAPIAAPRVAATTPLVDAPLAPSAATPRATFRVRGRVENEHGTPVGDAELRAAAPPHGPIRTEADARGRFEIELPVGGDWQVAATAEGLLPWEGSISVTKGAVEIVVTLHSGGQLSGQVRGSRNPAEYLVGVESESGGAQQTLSDPSGHYRFAVLAPGTYGVGLKLGGASWHDVGQVTIRAGERAAFDIVAPEAGVIELTAQWPGGANAARAASVELLELGAKRQSTHDIVLSADGRARLEGVLSGSYELRVRAPAAPPSMIIPVEVERGRTARVTVRWGGSRLAGRVMAPSGGGVPAMVQVQRLVPRGAGTVPEAEILFETQAAADGTYAVEGLLPGNYLVSARGDGYVAERVQVDGAQDLSVNLAFPVAGQLEVSVETADGPVEGAVVFAVREPLSDWAGQGKTDARGRARIASIPAGNYRVVTTLAGPDAVRTASARTRVSPGGESAVALFVASK